MNEDKVLGGFKFESGLDPVTIGIWMWGIPIVVPSLDGTLVAVVLLDTQGAFDHKAPLNETKNIFGLSAGLSNVLVRYVS